MSSRSAGPKCFDLRWFYENSHHVLPIVTYDFKQASMILGSWQEVLAVLAIPTVGILQFLTEAFCSNLFNFQSLLAARYQQVQSFEARKFLQIHTTQFLALVVHAG